MNSAPNTTPAGASAAAEDNTLASRISRALAARIVEGTLAPGERLRQDHVAAEFGASHVPVREAFRRLEAQGLVSSEPRRGVRVAGLDPRAVREVTEMRAALEALALRHAVPHLAPDDLRRAREALAASAASTDLRVWERANHDFHLALLAPCGMPRLLAAIEDLQAAGSRILFAAWQTQDWQPRSQKEHRLILRAVEQGEAEDAAQRLSRHILSAGDALTKSLKTAQPRQP